MPSRKWFKVVRQMRLERKDIRVLRKGDNKSVNLCSLAIVARREVRAVKEAKEAVVEARKILVAKRTLVEAAAAEKKIKATQKLKVGADAKSAGEADGSKLSPAEHALVEAYVEAHAKVKVAEANAAAMALVAATAEKELRVVEAEEAKEAVEAAEKGLVAAGVTDRSKWPPAEQAIFKAWGEAVAKVAAMELVVATAEKELSMAKSKVVTEGLTKEESQFSEMKTNTGSAARLDNDDFTVVSSERGAGFFSTHTNVTAVTEEMPAPTPG